MHFHYFFNCMVFFLNFEFQATLLKQNIGNMRRQMQTSLGVRYKKPGVEGDSNVGSNDKENENYVQVSGIILLNKIEI